MKRWLSLLAIIGGFAGSITFLWLWPSVTSKGVSLSVKSNPDAAFGEPHEPPRLPNRVEFASQIQPIFTKHCVKCHAGPESKGKLRLDRRPPDGWLHEQGVIVPGQSESSELIRRVTSEDRESQMPPAQSLSPEEIHLLKQWIDEGAYWPEPLPQVAGDWSKAERAHWAFQPLRNPTIPKVRQQRWVRNPIDAFILAKLEEAGVAPAESATPHTLGRRLCYALTGLPPTLAQQERIAAMEEAKWEDWIDEWLAHSEYGEHWASYWLDLVRYADTNGYEDDSLKPFAWKYRDFVIRAFNSDRPYDEFVRLQIAGDLLPEAANDNFIAVGFLRLGAWDSEPDDELAGWFDQVDEMVSTTSLVFLGLTVGCARCHDHPLEPITSYDYYRMAAQFHGLSRPTKGRQEEAALSATPEQRRAAAAAQSQQRELQGLALMETDEARAAELRRRAAALEDRFRFDQAYRFVETERSREPTRRLLRGNPQQPGEFVSPGIPSILALEPWEADGPPRRHLADWLTDEMQALTARVIVNRVWAWHFGRGLVESPSNLGQSGSPPSHPELLEWLANWFVKEAGWSLKTLHRLILTSHTFQTRSESLSETSGQRVALFGAFPRRQLRAEELYDSLLSVAGLRSQEMYGPPDYPKVPEAVLASLTEQGHWGEPSPRGRRAIYAIVKRNLPVPMLEDFNFPDRANSCALRISQQTPTQALTLWNGSLAAECADALAKRVLREAPRDLKAQWTYAFKLAIGREPDERESQMLHQFLGFDRPVSRQNENDFHAFSEMCMVIFNLNEFVFVN